MTDERRRLLVRRGVGGELDAVLGREVVEEVGGAPRLDEVRHEQRVVDRLETCPLGVVDDDLHVAETGGELGIPAAHDDRLSLPGRGEAVGLDLDRHPAGGGRELPLGPGDVDARDLGRGSRQGLVELVHAAQEVAELEAAEDLLELRAVRRREHERCRVDVEREVAAHRRELLRRQRLLGVLAERLGAARRELVDVLEHGLEGPVLRDQLPGRLVPDPGDAGDVVGGVALEPDEVRHLLRRDAVAGDDALRRVHVDVGDPARGHHQADVVRAELKGVPVRRHDARPDRRFVGPGGERGDDVVSLPPLELEVPVAEGLHDRPEVRELLAEEVGHRPALDLVLGRELLAVHRARVPSDRDALRPVVGEELEEHVREAEEGVRREPLRRGELLRQREVRPVREVVPVDEEEVGLARRRVVELELGPGQRLRHATRESIPPAYRCRVRGSAPTAVLVTKSSRCARNACAAGRYARKRVEARGGPGAPASPCPGRPSGPARSWRARSPRPSGQCGPSP